MGSDEARRTVRGIYFMARQVFEDAYMREIIPANPIKVPRGVTPKREDKNPAWRHGAIFTVKEDSYGDPFPGRKDPRVEMHELVWEPPEPV